MEISIGAKFEKHVHTIIFSIFGQLNLLPNFCTNSLSFNCVSESQNRDCFFFIKKSKKRMSNDSSDESNLDPLMSTQLLHPSTTRSALPRTKPASKTAPETSGSDSGGKAKRGANWNEPDSFLLVKAVDYIENDPIGETCGSLLQLIADGESKAAKDLRITTYYNSELAPASVRSVKSINCRWTEMMTTYKFSFNLSGL